MDYTWKDCVAGAADGKSYLDFGTLEVAEATSGVLETYRVKEVSFGVAVLNLDAQATFILEGRIGANWFSLPSTQITVTPVADPETNKATGLLTYSHCATLDAMRCRFVVAAGGTLVPVADILAKGVRVDH